MVRLLSASATVILLTFVGQASAFTPSSAPSSPAANVVTFGPQDDGPLVNPVRRTLIGRREGDGCRFNPPALELRNFERAVAMRQLSVDYGNCTTLIEIGTPAKVPADESGGDSDAWTGAQQKTTVRKSTARRALAAATATSSGYYEVYFEDRVGLDVNKTRAKLTWTWNGTCVTSSSPSVYWWWRSETGWWKDDFNSTARATQSCSSHYTYGTGVFGNTAFCGYFLYTKAEDVRFRGGYAGGYGGQVGSAFNSQSCQPLHWEAILVKTS